MRGERDGPPVAVKVEPQLGELRSKGGNRRRVDFRSVHATGPARFGVKPGGDRQLKLPARAALKLLIMYWDEIDHGILLLLGRLPLR